LTDALGNDLSLELSSINSDREGSFNIHAIALLLTLAAISGVLGYP